MELKILGMYRHKKRNKTYTVMDRAKLQISYEKIGALRDDLERWTWVVYQDLDGQTFVRPEKEFLDGRFEEIVA